MSSILKLFLALSMLLPVFACSSGSNGKGSVIILPRPGKVHDKIRCNSDNRFTYSLYLPSSCPGSIGNKSGQKRYPLILAFDPQGDGSLPVRSFSSLAEKYGFILLGSNDSRNMQSPAESEAVVQAMFDEILTRLPVDTSAVYLMGFSGGSRVAAAAALNRPLVRGVIACGAGFPSGVQPPLRKFDYFGIVGRGDFNLSEMVSLDKALAQMDFRHFILEFDGIHAWPSRSQIEKAWSWNMFNAMKDSRLKKNDELVKVFSLNMTADYDSLVKQGRLLYARQNLAFRISALEGLAEVSSLKSQMGILEASPAYKRALKQFEEIMDKEQREQQLLSESMFSRDLKWWKARIPGYRNNRKPGLSAEDTLMNHRILAFLGLFCYSNANAMIRQGNPDQAQMVIAVYILVEPENPEPYYMLAVLSGRKNDSTGALNYLKQAVDKGFRNKGRTQSQPEFEMLRENTKYFDLIKSMQ